MERLTKKQPEAEISLSLPLPQFMEIFENEDNKNMNVTDRLMGQHASSTHQANIQ